MEGTIRRLLSVCAALVCAALAVSVQPARAADSATLFEQPGRDANASRHLAYGHPGDRIATTVDTFGLEVVASGGPLGTISRMRFVPPAGETLRPGLYLDAVQPYSGDGARPAISVATDSDGCSTHLGDFEIKDIAVIDGAVRRLWLLYETHCEGAAQATFGEIRIGMDADPRLELTPSLLRWPAGDVGRRSDVQPVTVRAPTPMTIDRVAIGGGQASSFGVRADECSGRTLPAGGLCRVWLRFEPQTAEAARSTLRVSGGGADVDTRLEAFAHGGSTRMVITPEPGEEISGGRPRDLGPPTAEVLVHGGPTHVAFVVRDPHERWTGDFRAPAGERLQARTYAPAGGRGASDTAATFGVTGQHTGCNASTGSFTVTDVAFAANGRVRRFGATFAQRCDESSKTMRGRFDFRAGDATAAPPWLGGPALGAPDPFPDPPRTRPSASDALTVGGLAAAGDGPAPRSAGNGEPASVLRAAAPPGGLRLRRQGAVEVAVRCSRYEAPCRGVVTLAARRGGVLARRTVSVARGARSRATIRLDARARRLIRRGRRTVRLRTPSHATGWMPLRPTRTRGRARG